MKSRKGMSSTATIVLVIIGAVVISAGVGLAYMFTQGAIGDTNGEEDEDLEPAEARWDDRSVAHTVEVQDLDRNDVDDATVYFYDEQPDAWEDNQGIDSELASGDYLFSQETDENGEVEISERPGEYHLVVEAEGKYYDFQTVEVADGSETDESLSDYNQNPRSDTVRMAERYVLDDETFELGIDEETEALREWDAEATFRPDDSSEYRLDRVRMMTGSELGDTDEYVDPTEDSTGDGSYDEGVERAWIEILEDRDGQSETETVFNPSSGVDDFGVSNTVDLDVSGMDYDNNNPMTVAVFVETSSASDDEDAAEPEDGTLSASEVPFGLQFFDAEGNGSQQMEVVG